MSKAPIDMNNPFVSIQGYHCFGCDPHNAIGLKLRFRLDGKTLRSTWDPGEDFQGYPGVIHGGIQATLADEVGGWCIYALLGTAGVTRNLNVEYLTPARIADGPFHLAARVSQSDQKSATIGVELTNARGEICAVAACEYAIFSEMVARKRFYFPGKEAFLGGG